MKADAINLEQLRTIVEAMDSDEFDRWGPELPTFGGEAPENTDDVWSWDKARLLVTNYNCGFQIVDRAEWGRS